MNRITNSDHPRPQLRREWWAFAVGLILGIAGGCLMRLKQMPQTRDPKIAQPSVEAPIVFQPNGSVVQEPTRPQLDAMRNLPLLRFFAGRRHKYVWSVSFCWVALFLSGVVINALAGSLLSPSAASGLTKDLPSELGIMGGVLSFVSRSNARMAFLDDGGVLILIALLLPLFTTAELAFYSKIGPMLAQLHVEGIHVDLAEKQTYLGAVKKYDRAFNALITNFLAAGIGIVTIALLMLSRRQLDWWGGTSRLGPFIYTLVIGTFFCYHLSGIGTFKGWAGIRFCLEYLHSDRLIFNLQPCHADESNGLGQLGQLIVSVYWGALITVVSLFVTYKFNVFYGWTGALAILALFGTIDYSIFVTVPTVMVYQQAVRFRSKQLAIC